MSASELRRRTPASAPLHSIGDDRARLHRPGVESKAGQAVKPLDEVDWTRATPHTCDGTTLTFGEVYQRVHTNAVKDVRFEFEKMTPEQKDLLIMHQQEELKKLWRR